MSGGGKGADDGDAPRARVGRVRADLAVVEQGLAPSRERARALILAGEVLEGDRPVGKAGQLVEQGAALRLRSEPMPYVSRGGLKLAHALAAFGLDVRGKVAVDVGASTGGFTDCLLQAGAAGVTCVDVGHGQLAWKIASDPRVTILDRTNIRHLEGLPARCDLAVVDVSFISLRLVLPVLPRLLVPGSPVVALVKPQFEVGRERIARGGVVRGADDRREALVAVAAHAGAELGAAVLGFASSGLPGPAGNRESFVWLAEAGRPGAVEDLEAAARRAEP
jgi:23S rRNA (cytidine1920-2'-O)/16S rRNA (cytidine1409-2'-O)-methyltransferase